MLRNLGFEDILRSEGKLAPVKNLVKLYKAMNYYDRIGPGSFLEWLRIHELLRYVHKAPSGQLRVVLDDSTDGEPYMTMSAPYHAVLKLSIAPDKPYHAFVVEACKEVFENSLATAVDELAACTTKRDLRMKLQVSDKAFDYKVLSAKERFGVAIGGTIGKPERTAILLLSPRSQIGFDDDSYNLRDKQLECAANYAFSNLA